MIMDKSEIQKRTKELLEKADGNLSYYKLSICIVKVKTT